MATTTFLRADRIPTILFVSATADIFLSRAEAIASQGWCAEVTCDLSEVPASVARRRPDAIVVDLDLADPVEGLELARQLRSDERSRRVPVIALTDGSVEDAAARALGAGCYQCLSKGCAHDALVAAVHDALVVAFVLARRRIEREGPPSSRRRTVGSVG